MHGLKKIGIIIWLCLSQKIYAQEKIVCGAENTEAYLGIIKDKKLALVANQTSVIGNTHIVDSLLSLKTDIVKVFCPEHGFRGTASAGEKVADDYDAQTNIVVKSLYGKNKKPTEGDLKNIDIVLFDLQDVGARFYTYISTMYYVMQACAEQDKKLVVLDRPNPNGFYIDGPVLQDSFASFVGMHTVPVVYGMTIGEYAQMINEEGWLGTNLKCDLQIVPLIHYTHKSRYHLPINPSPNLPNDLAIYLYPSLCFFEGTTISVGRGTDKPFQIYGHPNLKTGNFLFTPQNRLGATRPPYLNEVCRGFDLTQENIDTLKGEINLNYLIRAYTYFPDQEMFFNSFFNKLVGNSVLKKQIIAGLSAEEIRKTWKKDIDNFKSIRKKYLLYPDFE